MTAPHFNNILLYIIFTSDNDPSILYLLQCYVIARISNAKAFRVHRRATHYVCCMETLRSPSLATCSIKPKTLFLLISVVRIEKYTSFFSIRVQRYEIYDHFHCKKGKDRKPDIQALDRGNANLIWSFLHPRCVNSLAVLGLIAAEAVGEGEADGAEAGVFAAQVLAWPVAFGGDHHCLEEVVAVKG